MSRKEPSDLSLERVAAYARLLELPSLPSGEARAAVRTDLPVYNDGRPCAVLLTPHPDDECLSGGLPLRLAREKGWHILNVAVTLGSNVARRAGRRDELARACALLGFDCMVAEDDGFSNVTAAARDADPAAWQTKVVRIASILETLRPQLVFMPHADDWHASHIGTHLLGMDALAFLPKDFSSALVLNEYWYPLLHPNMTVGLAPDVVALLLEALSCHVGEISRNAYDHRFPAYLIDTVRRSECVIGAGTKTESMRFAQMYRFGLWTKGRFVPSALTRTLMPTDSLDTLFD